MPNDLSLAKNQPMSDRAAYSMLSIIASLLAFDFYMSWPLTLITFLIMVWIGYKMFQNMRGQKGAFSLDVLATGLIIMILQLIMIAGITSMKWLGIE